jgi:dolichol-phosphate mannosyltransferase
MLSIIIPTLNERNNIDENIKIFSNLLNKIKYEIIFVDDASDDGTFEYCQKLGLTSPNIRSILRDDRKGLSSALVEGILSAKYPIVCAVDADLQYDLSNVLEAYNLIAKEDFDIVIMSRTMLTDRSKTDLSNKRLIMTSLSSKISRLITPRIKDPNSGFFLLKKKLILDEINNLSKVGFKLLLDILITYKKKKLKIFEIETDFNERKFGESKLNLGIFVDLIEMFIDKYTNRIISGSFFLFLLSGSISFFIQTYFIILDNYPYFTKVNIILISSLVAMVLNFYLNNEITFREKKLKGKFFYMGAFKFILICSIGFFININVQNKLNFFNFYTFSISTLIASFWNYSVSKNFVWKIK